MEASEHCFDLPAVFVAAFIILDRARAIATTGDYRDRALIVQGGANAVGILIAVGDHPF